MLHTPESWQKYFFMVISNFCSWFQIFCELVVTLNENHWLKCLTSSLIMEEHICYWYNNLNSIFCEIFIRCLKAFGGSIFPSLPPFFIKMKQKLAKQVLTKKNRENGENPSSSKFCVQHPFVGQNILQITWLARKNIPLTWKIVTFFIF